MQDPEEPKKRTRLYILEHDIIPKAISVRTLEKKGTSCITKSYQLFCRPPHYKLIYPYLVCYLSLYLVYAPYYSLITYSYICYTRPIILLYTRLMFCSNPFMPLHKCHYKLIYYIINPLHKCHYKYLIYPLCHYKLMYPLL